MTMKLNKKIQPTLRLRPALSTGGWLIISAALLLVLCGCTVLTYTSPSGERFARSSLGAKTSVSGLTIETDTNGVRRVELRGYRNDTQQAMGAVTEAAVRGALEALKH